MQQYLDFLKDILENGVRKGDRTGTGTLSVFGRQMRFDLSATFPLVTTKKIYLKAVIHELLWFLSGSTNTKYLTDNGVTIWDEWSAPEDVYTTEAITDVESYELFCQGHGGGDVEVAGGHFRRYLINRLRDTGKMDKDDVVLSRDIRITGTYDLLRRYPVECTAIFDNCGIPREKQVLVKKKGDLGRVYGAQWRDWIGPNGEHIDQIKNVIHRLKTNPDCRRLIVTAWQPAEVDKQALPPCHCFFQFWTRELDRKEIIDWVRANLPQEDQRIKQQLMKEIDAELFLNNDDALIARNYELYTAVPGVPTRALSCQLYQRSADAFLGVPFNIASYALLVMMVAQVCNMAAGEFIWTGGDCHVYTNHLEQVELQLTRIPYGLPTMRINPDVKDIFGFKYEDFTLEGYESHPAIKAPVAV